MTELTRLSLVSIGALFLVGILTTSTDVFYIFDPWLIQSFGVDWLTIHIGYSIVAAFIFLELSYRTLRLSQWPWAQLLKWVPITLWSLASLGWSAAPKSSLWFWFHEVLLGAAIMVWGYALGYRGLLTTNAIKLTGLGVVTYVSLKVLLTEHRWEEAFGTTWFALVFPLALWWLADECKRSARSFILVLVLILCVQAVVVHQLPQRMYVLTLFVTTVACLLVFRLLGIEPTPVYRWRGALGVLGLVFGYLFLVLVEARGSGSALIADSQTVAPGGDASRWYFVFPRSERWVVFGFWLQQGFTNWFGGVGLGLPALREAYGHAVASVDPDLQYHLGNALNYFIDLWLHLGVVGLLLQLYLLREILGDSVKYFHRMGNDYKTAAIVAALVFLAVFFRNLVNDGFRTDNVIAFWLVVGLILGVQVASRDRIVHDQPRES